MAIVLKAKKSVVFAGSTSPPTQISLTSGWDATFGSATYAPVADDLVIVSYGVGGTSDVSIGVTTAGYTEIVELFHNETGADVSLSVSYKKMSGSPDTTLDLTATGNAQNGGAVIVEVWGGVDTTTPMDVAATSIAAGDGGRPNPPAITPTTAGAVVVVVGSNASNVTDAVFTQTGSELSNFLSATSPDTLDATVGTGDFSWTSGAFDPVAWLGGTTGVQDSWAAVTIALRPSSGGAQTLSPSLFTDTQTFYAATIAPGAVDLAPSLLTNTQTFYGQTVSPAAITIAPALVTNSQTFFAATVTVGAVALAPALVTNNQTFFGQTIAVGAVSLDAPLLTNSQTFYAQEVTVGAVSLSPGLVANGQTFFASEVSAGPVTLAPSLLTNSQIFYSPTLSQAAGTQTLDAGLYTNPQTFFAATVSAGSVTLTSTLLANTQVFYGSTVVVAPSAFQPEAEPPVAGWVQDNEPPRVGGGVFDAGVFDPSIFDTGGGTFTREAEPL